MSRASYKAAVEWIAFNDEAGVEYNQDDLSGLISVALVADLFGKEPMKVAGDVMDVRWANGIKIGRRVSSLDISQRAKFTPTAYGREE